MKMTNTENNARDAAWYDTRTAYMEGFLTEERREVLRRTAAMRTRYMTILTENTFHPQNASALCVTAKRSDCRTCTRWRRFAASTPMST